MWRSNVVAGLCLISIVIVMIEETVPKLFSFEPYTNLSVLAKVKHVWSIMHPFCYVWLTLGSLQIKFWSGAYSTQSPCVA